MSKALVDLVPEADRFEDAPHPRETTGLVGHGAAEVQLLDAYRSGRLPQAVLIGGPAGIGKATLAWRLARFIAAHPDRTADAVQSAENLFVAPDDPTARRINAGAQGDLFVLRREWNEKTKRLYSEIRADDVRRAIVMFQRSAGRGGYRTCILDCAEDLNRSGANALLKLIEEPPPHSLFLIVAHRPAQVLPTIRSRCRKLMLKPLSTAETLAVVEEVGAPWASRPMVERQAAAARAEGSAQAALRLLGGGGLELDGQMRRLLQGLPAVDWRTVHAHRRQGRRPRRRHQLRRHAWRDLRLARCRRPCGRCGGRRTRSPCALCGGMGEDHAGGSRVRGAEPRPTPIRADDVCRTVRRVVRSTFLNA